MPEVSQRTFATGVVVLLLIHSCIAIPMALSLNIWTDEASSLYATQNGFWVAFQAAGAEQKQAPLYFWILSLWRTIDGSIFFARAFSILCSLLSICVFAVLARRFFSRAGALLATAFIALHPFLIWASVEVRVYSMVVLLSVILIHLFFEGFVDEGETHYDKRTQWLFLAVAIISLYTNYYLGFLLAGFFFSLILTGRWRTAMSYAGLMVLAGIAFLPLALTTVAELQSRRSGSVATWHVIDGVKIVWNHILTFLLPTEIFTPEQQSTASLLRGWIARFAIAAVALAAIWKRKQITSQALMFVVMTATVGGFMIAAGYLVGPSLIVIRHAATMFVAVVFGFSILSRDILAKTSGKAHLLAIVCVVPLVAISFIYGVLNIYPNQTKRGDWARVAQFIEQNESSNQPIIVYPSFDALSPRYHYSGVNAILPDERWFDFIHSPGNVSPETMRAEIEFVVAEIPNDADRIWLAVGDLCTGNAGCTPLQNYIEANYTIEIERDFYLEKLYLLKKRPQ